MMRQDVELTIENMYTDAAKISEILEMLILNHVEPRWNGHVPYIDLEHFLLTALSIPLNVLRDIERWDRLNVDGDLTTETLDSMFEDWIYKQR